MQRNIFHNMFERFLGQASFVVLEHKDPGSLGHDFGINKGEGEIGKQK